MEIRLMMKSPNFAGEHKGISKNIHIMIAVFLLTCVSILLGCESEPSVMYKGVGLSTDPVPLIEGGRYGRLPSGLCYYIVENTKHSDTAYAYMAVNVGSADENVRQQGYANFVRTLLAETGVNNSTSSIDYTVFDFVGSTYTDDDEIKKVSDILFTKINNVINDSSFTNSRIDDARSKILSDIEDSTIEEIVEIKKNSFFYAGSPFPENRVNILGTTESVTNARTIDLERFYRVWYRPENLCLIFIGDFDGAQLEETIKTRIKVPNAKKPFDRTIYELPVPQKNSTVMEVFTDENIKQTEITFFYKMHPARPKNNLEGLRSEINEEIIANILTERFKVMLRENGDKDYPFNSINFLHNKVGKTSQYFCIGFTPKKLDQFPGVLTDQEITDLAISTMASEIKSIVKKGFTDEEIKNSKAQYIISLQDLMNSTIEQDTPAYLSVLFLRNYMYNESAASASYQLQIAEDLMPQITKKELNKTLQTYLGLSDLRIFASSKPEDAPQIAVDSL